MKAWRIDELGHPSTALRLAEIDAPVPGSGELAIDVESAVVNFADILLCQGIYQDRPPVPFAPGLEVCGVVTSVGDGMDVPVGARVSGMAALPSGAFAEAALVRAPSAVEVPHEVPAADAAALASTYLTSHVALHRRAHLQPGETLLVHGATGGVGSAAVQLGVAAGATVIATAGGEAKARVAKELGAHHVIDHRVDDVRERVLELTAGRGVDVAYDPVGGALGDLTRRLMAWEGRLLVIGFASGEIPSYPANHVLVKNYSVMGLHWGAYTEHGGRPVLEAAHADLLRLYAEGAIAPRIHSTIGLDEVPDALAALEAREVLGRIVLVTGGADRARHG
ncbi:MAG: NADPH:quinone oxidoreductase family protein [Actinomycetota bacterium]|nr:NADPH:quinone oxidoreductase family protein [Actinomycetota bacterium]